MDGTYNNSAVEELISAISKLDGVGDKGSVAEEIRGEFDLTKDRSIYSGRDFSIRFSSAKGRSFANTVLSLSQLQKIDSKPFFVCLVTPQQNHLFLANSTLIRKISHSSHELRENNIRGSFNGSDIVKELGGIENTPANFERLYAEHQQFSFAENLARLVEATNGIVPKYVKKAFSDSELKALDQAVDRAEDFLSRSEFSVLRDDLEARVARVSNEIAIASFIDNVNVRGRIIEYLITATEDESRSLRDTLLSGAVRPEIHTAHDLGDYARNFEDFSTKTDIKTKVMFLSSNPKGYNVDKLLNFLVEERSVYLIFLVGLDESGNVLTRLTSIFGSTLMNGTSIKEHWSGRGSRGVTQFDGQQVKKLLAGHPNEIDVPAAKRFLRGLADR